MSSAAASSARAAPGSAEERAARKAVSRIERQLKRVLTRESELNAAIIAAGQDYEKLAAASAELTTVLAERDGLESEWLEASEVLES